MEYKWGLFDFTPEFLVYSLVAAVVFHAIWIALASKFNPLYILATIFLVAAPFSGAMYFTGIGMVKLIRIYMTCLIPLAGIIMIRKTGLGSASILFMIFLVFYVGSSFWAESATEAFLRKGLYGLLMASGIVMAASLRSFEALRNAMRVLLPGCMVFAALIAGYMLAHPGELGKRLSAYTINPNGIGETSAYMAILCAYIALYDNSKAFKVTAYITGATLATFIPFTGSRAGFFIALIGCAILFVPLVRRPVVFTMVLLVIAGTAFGISQFAQSEYTSRLSEFDFQSRQAPWRDAYMLIREKPFIGHGFVASTDARELFSLNMHSSYLQIAVETGFIGLTFLLIALFWTLIRAVGAYRISKAVPYVPPIYLALALLVSNLLSGFVDIGWVVGTTVNALVFAFSIGLIDRIPDMAANLAYASDEIDPEYAAQQQEIWAVNSVA
jgi:O-antigen ligase